MRRKKKHQNKRRGRRELVEGAQVAARGQKKPTFALSSVSAGLQVSCWCLGAVGPSQKTRLTSVDTLRRQERGTKEGTWRTGRGQKQK